MLFARRSPAEDDDDQAATHVFARRESQLFDAYSGKRIAPKMPAIDNGGGMATAAGPHLVGVFGRRLGRVAY